MQQDEKRNTLIVALRRWAMGLFLLGQIIFYAIGAPHMSIAAKRGSLGGTTGINTFIFDAAGVIFWGIVIALYEEEPAPIHKRWLRDLSILLCAIASLTVFLFNGYAFTVA